MCNLSYDIEERGIAKEKKAWIKKLNGKLSIKEIAELAQLSVKEVEKILGQ